MPEMIHSVQDDMVNLDIIRAILYNVYAKVMFAWVACCYFQDISIHLLPI
jgi:hypothetical protein